MPWVGEPQNLYGQGESFKARNPGAKVMGGGAFEHLQPEAKLNISREVSLQESYLKNFERFHVKVLVYLPIFP